MIFVSQNIIGNYYFYNILSMCDLDLSIKFTFEAIVNAKFLFLNVLLKRRPDSSFKISVLRKSI